MNNIKHLIFDLGGVLLNLDMPRTEKAFQQLGLGHISNVFSHLQPDPLFLQLEIGEISASKFIDHLQQQANPGTTHQQLIDAWNALLLDYRKESLDFLEKLSGQYNIFLLSNTNAIHEDFFQAQFARERGKDKLDSLFTRAYYSHLIGLRKPDRRAYQLILEENDLWPENVIFVDDNRSNIESANLLGLHTLHLEAGKTIEQELHAWI